MRTRSSETMELESRPFKPPRRAVISQIRWLLLAFKGDNSLEETGIDQLVGFRCCLKLCNKRIQIETHQSRIPSSQGRNKKEENWRAERGGRVGLRNRRKKTVATIVEACVELANCVTDRWWQMATTEHAVLLHHPKILLFSMNCRRCWFSFRVERISASHITLSRRGVAPLSSRFLRSSQDTHRFSPDVSPRCSPETKDTLDVVCLSLVMSLLCLHIPRDTGIPVGSTILRSRVARLTWFADT